MAEPDTVRYREDAVHGRARPGSVNAPGSRHRYPNSPQAEPLRHVSLHPRCEDLMATDHEPRYYGALAQLRSSLNRLLARHLRRSADGRKAISHATIADRRQCFDRMLRELHALGFPLRAIGNFKPKHARVLMQHWEARGVSASTLQKRWSYLKLLCRWIGKPGMLGEAGDYLQAPDRYRRTTAARTDRSWTGQGVDPLEVLARVVSKDVDVAQVLCLQLAFGLRLQEASLLRPLQDDHGEVLQVIAGTKGGRPRRVPIETESQRAVLNEARSLVKHTARRSLIPVHYDLRRWLNHCYTVFRACGITRAEGITSHGVRHQYANDLYEQLTGSSSPVRGGGPPADPAQAKAARLTVSARLGHAREAITTAYFGSSHRPPATPTGREVLVHEQCLQWRARLTELLTLRRDGRRALGERTRTYRQRLLNQWVREWLEIGAAPDTPEQLSEAQVDGLLQSWHQRRLSPATIRNHRQFLAQVCTRLGRADLAQRVKQYRAVLPG